jgi:hypothetical protein
MFIGQIKKLRNIKWVLMFLNQVKSETLQSDQKAKEHDVDLYIPSPISAQFAIPARTTPFFILPRSPTPRLPAPHGLAAPELLHRPPLQHLQRPSGFAPPSPDRAPLAPAGAALPVRLGPGPSCCCCTRQPRLWPVPPHLSAQAPISPAIVPPVGPGSDRHRPTLPRPRPARPGRRRLAHPPESRSLPLPLHSSAQAPADAAPPVCTGPDLSHHCCARPPGLRSAPPCPARAVHWPPQHRQP